MIKQAHMVLLPEGGYCWCAKEEPGTPYVGQVRKGNMRHTGLMGSLVQLPW